MINLNVDGAEWTKTIAQLTNQLGDELTRARQRPYSEASLAIAARLGLPGLQVQILYELGRDTAATARKSAGQAGAQALLEKAVGYWERARVLSQSRPALETVNYWLFPAPAPRIAGETLPALWSAYQTLNRQDDAQKVLTEALDISRPFGENAVLHTLRQLSFSAQTLFSQNRSEAALRSNQDALVRLSRALGPRSQLALVKQMTGLSGPGPYRPDLEEEAVALALGLDDPHERAVTFEWLTRGVLSKARITGATAGDIAALLPASYRQLREVCLAAGELELTADALANEAETCVYVRPEEPALATTTYRQAIQLADRAGNALKVAQIANRAAEPPTGRPTHADQIALAGIAASAARKANDSLELVKALRLGSETVEDMQQAVAAAVRYTEQSGAPAQELRSLMNLATLQRGRGDYQAAIDTQRRRAERSRVGTAAKPGNSDELNAYEVIVQIYSEIGEPSLARAAADQLRQLLETTVIEAQRPVVFSIATAYTRLGRIAKILGEPVDAMRYWDEALARLADPTVKDIGNLTRRDILEDRATLYAQLGDFDASLKDWQDVRPLMASTNRNFYGFSVTGHTVAWKTAIAWTHALAGRADTALALAREAAAELQGDTSGLWAGQWFDAQCR